MPTFSSTEVLLHARSAKACAALFAFAFIAFAAPRVQADALSDGASHYKPFAVERIAKALAGAKELRAAVKAGDVKAARAAWIRSRRGWEAAEPITGTFFAKLDEAIDAWPDAKHGYHAIEAALFSGKLDGVGAPADELVSNLTAFHAQVSAKSFTFSPQGLLDGAGKLAYEIGENKAKGGESPYAGTSLLDMRENVEGLEAIYKLVFEAALQAKDAKLAEAIDDQIEDVEALVKVKDLKELDQPALNQASEELAVLMQDAAPKLGLKKPALAE